MDDVIAVAQGGAERQHRVFGFPGYRGEKPFESTYCAVKDSVLSLCPPLRHGNHVIHIAVYMVRLAEVWGGGRLCGW